jgi:hypothetical protein
VSTMAPMTAQIAEPARPLGILVPPHVVPELPSLFRNDRIAERVRLTPDAQRFGLMVVVSRPVSQGVLALAAEWWPAGLSELGVPKVALIVGVDSWMESLAAHPDLTRTFGTGGIDLTILHEGHLATDEIVAWFEGRPPRYPFGAAELERLRVRLREREDSWGLLNLERLADQLRAGQPAASMRLGKH